MDAVKFGLRVKSKTRLKCCVNNCENSYSKNLDLRFYEFPDPGKRFVYIDNFFGKIEKIDQFKAWKNALKISKVNKSMKVCSAHFKKDNFMLTSTAEKRQHLQKNAVPSGNFPGLDQKKITDENRKIRLLQRDRRKEGQKNVNVENKHSQHEVSIKISQKIDIEDDSCKKEKQASLMGVDEKITEDQIDEDSINILNKNNITEEKVQVTTRDIQIQVSNDLLQTNFVNFINSDVKLSTACGLESFQLLNTIFDIVSDKFRHKFEHQNNKLDIYAKVIMVYMKLKQNLSYSFLSVLFDCYTPKHCQQIFHDVIKMLSESLKPAITWASREVISKNIPECFKEFTDVLDCTEIFTQCPSNLCCQLITYSNYKKCQTCKFLTGVTPAGYISYISKTYGGRASDQAIFKQSELISLLEPEDAIMVDKGFTVDEICQVNRWKLYRPPFLKNKKQLSKEESILTAKIARARVYVERSNQRIKIFQILGETLPANLIPLVDDIFTVICATVNLSAPILKNDKFLGQSDSNK